MRVTRRWMLGSAFALILIGAGVGIVAATDGDEDDAAEQVAAGSDRDQAEAAALAETGGGTVSSVETGDDGAAYGVEVSSGSDEVEVSLDSSFGVLSTDQESSDGTDGSESDSDELAAGTDRDRAIEAALAEAGGGTVTDVEVGDDGATFGVEILRDDGTEVEISLDASFAVIGTELDD